MKHALLVVCLLLSVLSPPGGSHEAEASRTSKRVVKGSKAVKKGSRARKRRARQAKKPNRDKQIRKRRARQAKNRRTRLEQAHAAATKSKRPRRRAKRKPEGDRLADAGPAGNTSAGGVLQVDFDQAGEVDGQGPLDRDTNVTGAMFAAAVGLHATLQAGGFVQGESLPDLLGRMGRVNSARSGNTGAVNIGDRALAFPPVIRLDEWRRPVD